MFWRDAVGNRWVEISANVIQHNLQQVRTLLDSGVKIIGVVKANAYGLGAVEVARILATSGVAMVAVTTVEEGLELREGGISLPILILSPFLPEEAELIIKYELTPSISNLNQVSALAAQVRLKGLLSVHIKVETGMGRTGLELTDARSFFTSLLKHPEIYVEGIFTHLAQAKKGDEYSEEQFEKFKEVIAIAEELGYKLSYCHICNSAATLDLPHMHLNAVRIGTVLYGQLPAGVKKRLNLKDPWSLKARIINVREVARGESIGYGREFIASKMTRVAVIPLGWADGLTVFPSIKPKNFLDLVKMIAKLVLEFFGKSKTSTVHIDKSSYRLIGRLGMQLSMVEVDGRVKTGDVVCLNMRRLSTNPRIPRVYFIEKSPYLISMPAGIYPVQRDEVALESKEKDNKRLAKEGE